MLRLDTVLSPSRPGGHGARGHTWRLAAYTLTPVTWNFRVTFSFEVPRNGSNRSRTWESANPISASNDNSSAAGRAPPIQPDHRSMSRRIDSGSSDATTMSA